MTCDYKVLIVDDDLRLRNLISTYLEQQGFQVALAVDARDAFHKINTSAPNIIILDINLPGIDGLSICHKLRQMGINTPIIILTARGEESDRIHGLEIGADDYLTKPFNPRELVARIRAILRRHDTAISSHFEGDASIYRFDKYVFDVKKQALFTNGEVIHLSSGEFALLHLLLREVGKPLSRDQLVARMASREHQPDQRAIDMLVSRLRKKLDSDSSETSLIRTLRGVGYILVGDVLVDRRL